MSLDSINLKEIQETEMRIIEGGGFFRSLGWFAGATAKEIATGWGDFADQMADGFGRVF